MNSAQTYIHIQFIASEIKCKKKCDHRLFFFLVWCSYEPFFKFSCNMKNLSNILFLTLNTNVLVYAHIYIMCV